MPNTGSSKLISKLKDQDAFGTPFSMRLEKGKTSINSIVGSILSILLFLAMTMYAYQKWDILANKKDVDILSTQNDLFFDYNDKFTY